MREGKKGTYVSPIFGSLAMVNGFLNKNFKQ